MILIDHKGHLVSDINLEELHAFAYHIGLNRRWFKGVRKGHPHYDLTTVRMRDKALTAGAEPVFSSDLARRMARV